ncbi:MAG: hypothetical protein MRY83_22605 [Flavobacteriales bacterium]|nr:hypothetical protein [Flavobacteriales bacterium]
MKLIKSIFILTLSTLVVFSSCKKKEEDEPAPELPPESTFVMDFADFKDTTGGGKNGAPGFEVLTDSTKWNFVHSALTVWGWNLAITIHSAIPVAAFRESFNHQWQYDANAQVWSWPYSVTVGAKTYDCRLEASLSGSDVIWEMYISQGNAYTDFLWYEGRSAIDRLSGSWRLYKDPQSGTGTPYIDIDWTRNGQGTADIRYTNIIPGDNANGSYIYFAVDQDSTSNSVGSYDRQYDVFKKVDNNLTEILWNSTSKHGRVKDEKRFSDTNWHCWNTTFEDDICN